MDMVNNVAVRSLTKGDEAEWRQLWEGYNTFYERVIPEDVTRTTWARFFDTSEPVHALVASAGAELAGMVHYIFHRNTSIIQPICYLQDLFSRPDLRGRGIGKRLIEAVYAQAEAAGAPRVYWLTHETNATAMLLYDGVAERSGFVQYRKSFT